jgi:DNA-binding CsgD family transcriptional regulator
VHGYSYERQQLLALLDFARSGAGGAVLIEGDAGIGKSTLCQSLIESATDMIVLTARGIESEAVIPFAGLFDLFAPLGSQIEELPAVQATALKGALALGPSEEGDPLTIAAATLNLLGGGTPTLAVIDDAQWIDDSSIAALTFAANRLADRSAAVVLTRRGPSDEADRLRGLSKIHLDGLNLEAARSLLHSTYESCDPRVVERLWVETGGNPLALVELAKTLDRRVLEGAAPIPNTLPIGPHLAAVFGDRLKQLDNRSRFALLLLATVRESRLDWLRVLDAADMTADDLEPALALGLLETVESQPRFRHPLVRASVSGTSSATDQRRVQAILADAFADDPDRRVWHLSAASAGPDEELARRLMEVASRSLKKSGYAEAASASLRARELSTTPATRLEAALAAARFKHLAGRSREAVPILEAALTEVDDPSSRAAIQEARGEIETWIGHPRDARDLLSNEADLVEADDPILAARLRAQASMSSVMILDLLTAKDLASRAFGVLGSDGGPFGILSTAALAGVLLLVGERDEGVALADRAFNGLNEFPLQDYALNLASYVTHCLALAERTESAISFAKRLVAYGRIHNAPAMLPVPLATLADLLSRTGDLPIALAHAEEALAISTEIGHTSHTAYSMVILGRTEALMGRPRATSLATRALEVLRSEGAEYIEGFAQHVLGLAALSEGRGDLAIQHLNEARLVTERHGVASAYFIPWAPDLVDALVQTGDREQASVVVKELEEQAVMGGSRWTSAVLNKCKGQLGGENAIEQFQEALSEFRGSGHFFDAARTNLALGEHLRRNRNRRESRVHLQAATTAFRQFGAQPWADRAQAELRAAGGEVKPSSAGVPDLTPQEIRISLRVMNGDTNAEIAEYLFLSPKTIENRLTTVYAKMGVRSRTQLSRVLREAGVTLDDAI